MTARDVAAIRVFVRRELLRFVRRPARIIAALGTPVLFWVFLAGGFSESLRPDQLSGAEYGAFLLPGMMTLVAVFASIFTSIHLIEDRQSGWLRTVLVAPVGRWSIAAGHVLGGGIVAFIQAAVLFIAIPILRVDVGVGAASACAFALFLTSIAVTAVGFAFAWRCETSSGFHAVMNLVLMPMWLLSGAFFPPDGAATWLQTIMNVNPLRWASDAVRAPMLDTFVWNEWMFDTPMMATCGFAVVAVLTAVVVVRSRTRVA